MSNLESIVLIQAQGLAGLRPDQQTPRSVGGGGWFCVFVSLGLGCLLDRGAALQETEHVFA
jgi:hypothetical protein